MPPFGRPAGNGVLHPVTGEDFEPAVIQLHGDVDGDLPGGRTQDLAHPVIQMEPPRRLVKARSGSQPRVLFIL